MTTINGVYMLNFSPGEFSEDPNLYAHPQMLKSLQSYRAEYGSSVSPSKSPGALARVYGHKSSMHYVIDNPPCKSMGESRAIDFFPGGCVHKAWATALHTKYFTRVGIYFDTRGNDGKPAVMMHGDIKPGPRLFWLRSGGKYVYSSHKNFWQLLHHEFLLAGV